jgi:signal transduction histidine kinase
MLLMSLVLVVLSVPLARNLAASRQQAVFVDRLEDTSRFASAAQQIGGDVDEDALRADLNRYAQLYRVSAAIVDLDGSVRLGQLDAPADQQRMLAPSLRNALAGRQSANPGTIWPWDKENLVVAVPVMHGDDVTAVALTISPTGALRRGTTRDLGVLGLCGLLALGICVALAYRLATWVLLPVYVLDRAAGEISAGTLSVRVSAARGPVELRTLGHSFNRMAEAVQNAMSRQRAFTADAAHQLRNPLTALMLRMEGLDPAAGQHVELAEAQDEAARLRLILDELLALANAEAVQAHPVPRDSAALLANAVSAWRPVAAGRDITFQFTAGRVAAGPLPWVLADPALVGSALDAVLDNAIKFSPEHGRITLTLAEEPGCVRVDVCDQGPGLADGEHERIGDRFWRSARSQNIPGSGLGLSIARRLLDATGATIEFGAPPAPASTGLRVTVRLPSASSQAMQDASTEPGPVQPEVPAATSPDAVDDRVFSAGGPAGGAR